MDLGASSRLQGMIENNKESNVDANSAQKVTEQPYVYSSTSAHVPKFGKKLARVGMLLKMIILICLLVLIAIHNHQKPQLQFVGKLILCGSILVI